MARKEIINGQGYNQGFYNANDNFIEIYQQINSLIDKGYGIVKDLGSNVDFNNLKTQGKYIVNYSTHTNAPNPDASIYFIDITGSPAYLIQEATNLQLDKYYRICSNNVWYGWQKIVTDKQPDWITGTLQNGWTGTFRYRKNNVGQIEVQFSIKAGTVAAYTTIAQFATGYVTAYPTPVMLIEAATGKIKWLYMSADGALRAPVNGEALIAGNDYFGTFIFTQ